MELIKAQNLAYKLILEHNLVGWRFKFDRAVRRFGSCHYAARTITLSKVLTWDNEEEIVNNILLHEVAHALAGRYAGHKQEWKRIATSIGCTADRCYGPEVIKPAPKYKAVCKSCYEEWFRHRKSPYELHCPCQKGKMDIEILEWKTL